MNYLAIFEPVQALMVEYAAENEKLTFDYDDPQGNKDARSHVYKLRQVKTKITDAHKKGKAEALAVCREIDAYKNKLMRQVEEMISVHNEPLLLIEKEKADAEAERLRKIQEAEEKAERERSVKLAKREAAVKAAEEKLAAEGAARRAAEEARKAGAERIERERQIAEDERERVLLEARANAEEAAIQHQREINAAIAKTKAEAEAKELAERRRIEAEQAEKERLAEVERKRQANKKHQTAIHDEILARLHEITQRETLVSGLILEALVAGTIPHVKIEY